MKKVIALSMRTVFAQGYFEPRDAISHDWVQRIDALGFNILLIPNTLSDPASYLEENEIEILLITGGDDLIIDHENAIKEKEYREITENSLIEKAINLNMPIFGICRGFQLINKYFGGSITFNLNEQSENDINHVNCNHEVMLVEPFKSMIGQSLISVNSYHNHFVKQDQLASCLKSFAISTNDNFVEGFVHNKLPIIAVQWHPERINPSIDLDNLIFSNLMNKGNFWKK